MLDIYTHSLTLFWLGNPISQIVMMKLLVASNSDTYKSMQTCIR